MGTFASCWSHPDLFSAIKATESVFKMVCLKHLSLRGPTYINTLHKWSHSVNSCHQSALQGAVTSQLLPTLTNKKASKYVNMIY